MIHGYFDFGPEQQFIVRQLHRLVHIVRLFKADDGVPICTLPDDFHVRYLSVFLVFVI